MGFVLLCTAQSRLMETVLTAAAASTVQTCQSGSLPVRRNPGP